MLSMNSLRAQQQEQQPPLPQPQVIQQTQTQSQVQYDPRSGPIMSPKDLEAAVMGQGQPPELKLRSVNPPPQPKQESAQSLYVPPFLLEFAI